MGSKGGNETAVGQAFTFREYRTCAVLKYCLPTLASFGIAILYESLDHTSLLRLIML